MAAADVQQPPSAPEAAPAIPDYMLDPNAVLKDEADWRHGKAPDYSNTRRVFEETKKSNHAPGSLESLVQNLVKNWEIEASFKEKVADWRTVDPKNYTFAINGGPPQDAEHMLKVGTYNAIIAPSSFYSGEHSDFEKSHKTFKRMMPTFAWEVLEVYSGPPRVAFKWRHWGVMKNDYVGWNDKGEKITFPAHGGLLDIQGLTVAKVDEGFKVQSLETWFDPLEMFRQFTPKAVQEKMAGMQDVQALTEQIDDTSLSMDKGVEIDNPNTGDDQHVEHEESRTAAPTTLSPHTDSRTGDAGACPFIAGQT